MKLYIVIPGDLKGAYRLPQVGHAVAEAFLKWGRSATPPGVTIPSSSESEGIFSLWAHDHKTIVVWELPPDMFRDMTEKAEQLRLHNETTTWREPDKNDEVQALVFRPSSDTEINYLLGKLIHLESSDMVLAR